MARPRKIGLDYFSVETSDFRTTAIGVLLRRHKSDGYAVVMYLKSAIFDKGYYLHFGEFERDELFDRFPWIMGEQLDAILDDCFRLEIFDRNLYDTEGVLTSIAIQKQFFFATVRRVHLDDDLKYLLISLEKEREKRGASQPQTSKKESKKSAKKSCKKSVVSFSEDADNAEVTASLGVSANNSIEKHSIEQHSIAQEHNFKKHEVSQSMCVKNQEKIYTQTKGSEVSDGKVGIVENSILGKPDYVDPFKNEAYYPVERIVEFLLSETSWKESKCMANGLKMEEFDALIRKFHTYYLDRFNPASDSKSHFTRYFLNWFRLEMKDRRTEALEQQRNDEREASYNARMAERDRRYHEHMDRIDWRNNPNRFESDRNARIAPLEYFQFDDPEHPENITHKRLAINENFAQVPGVPF